MRRHRELLILKPLSYIYRDYEGKETCLVGYRITLQFDQTCHYYFMKNNYTSNQSYQIKFVSTFISIKFKNYTLQFIYLKRFWIWNWALYYWKFGHCRAIVIDHLSAISFAQIDKKE